MKKIVSILAASIALAAFAPPAVAGVEDISVFEPLPAQAPASIWDFALSATYEDDTAFSSEGFSIWGVRADATTYLNEVFSVGAFYNAAWEDDGGESTYHRFGLTSRYDLPDFKMLRTTTFLGIDLGVAAHDGDYDPLASVWLGVSYPVAEALRVELAGGYNAIFDTSYRDSLSARLALVYEW